MKIDFSDVSPFKAVRMCFCGGCLDLQEHEENMRRIELMAELERSHVMVTITIEGEDRTEYMPFTPGDDPFEMPYIALSLIGAIPNWQ